MKRLLLATTAALTLTGAFAQNYPTKPVTFVVPFAAGGPTDKVARDLAEAMRKPLGGNIIVENVAGAGGTLGQTKGRQGSARRLHHPARPRGDGHLARPVPQPPVQDPGGLRVPRLDQRSTDDPDRAAHAAGQQLRRAAEVDRREQGQGEPRQRRTGFGLAPVRPAVPIDRQGRHGHGAVQGNGAGDDRPDRRAGGHHVRPDDEHHRRRSKARRSRPMPSPPRSA